MAKHIKVIKLNVHHFNTPDWKKLSKKLYSVNRDLMVAANRIISRLYLINNGTINLPEKTNKDGSIGEICPRTYAYQLMTGKCGDKVYEPTLVEISGGCKSAIAEKVSQRFKTDKKKLKRGEQSLSSFKKNIAMPIRASEINIVDKETVNLGLFAKGEDKISANVYVKGNNHEEVWKRILSGEYIAKSADLLHDDKNQWSIHLAYEFESKPSIINKECIIGIDLGMTDLVACAIMKPNGDFVEHKIFHGGMNFWKFFAQYEKIRKNIGHANRVAYGIRQGLGRQRKIRPLRKIKNKYALRRQAEIRNIAKAVADFAVSMDCKKAAFENLSWSKNKLMDDSAKEKLSTRKYLRKMFTKFNYYALKSAMKQKFAEVDIECVEVDAKYTSQNCSECGEHGVRKGKKFSCKCGTYKKKGECDSDINAARNIAIRGNITAPDNPGASTGSNPGQDIQENGARPPEREERPMVANGEMEFKSQDPLENSERLPNSTDTTTYCENVTGIITVKSPKK